MGRVHHIGDWPFRDEGGTGPLGTDGYFGDGAGLVIDDTAAPYVPTASFPLAYTTEEEAMWWLWRVQTWQITVSTPSGLLNATENMLVESILAPGATLGEEEDLITCHNGISYVLDHTIGDLHLLANLEICAVRVVDEAQVYYNPLTELWLPKIRLDVWFQKLTAPEDELRVGSEGSGVGADPFTATLNGQSINLTGSGDGAASIVLTATEYWSHGGLWNTSTGALNA